MNDDFVEAQGIVVDVLPNAMFRVLLDNGHEVLGVISGKMRKNRIRILQGDRIRMQFSQYDVTRGRIVSRLS